MQCMGFKTHVCEVREPSAPGSGWLSPLFLWKLGGMISEKTTRASLSQFFFPVVGTSKQISPTSPQAINSISYFSPLQPPFHAFQIFVPSEHSQRHGFTHKLVSAHGRSTMLWSHSSLLLFPHFQSTTGLCRDWQTHTPLSICRKRMKLRKWTFLVWIQFGFKALIVLRLQQNDKYSNHTGSCKSNALSRETTKHIATSLLKICMKWGDY